MNWIGPAVVIVLVGIIVLAVYRAGRKAERGAAAEKSAEVKDAQLEAGNQPRDRDAVADKLRRGRF